MARTKRGELGLAEDDFSTAIKLDPRLAFFWGLRGLLRQQRGDAKGAADDFAESLNLNPEQPDIAAKLQKLREVQDANQEPAAIKADDFKKMQSRTPLAAALKRLDAVMPTGKGFKPEPRDADKLRQDARSAIGQRKFEEAVSLFTRSMSRADDALRPGIILDLAWLLATCPDEKIRDGKRAVDVAQQVLSAWNETDVGLCDTLAAAYAEQGDFAQAVRWQTKAIELLKNDLQRSALQKRLSLYQAGQPYHFR